MTRHAVVSSEEWIEARKELLAKEKEFSRLRDELTQLRRELPWEQVEKTYVFDSADGKESLADLFGDCSQLIVYHFMFSPDWEEGCRCCSMVADHFNPLQEHLQARDVSLVAISRAPLDKLRSFRERMDWRFKWVSSHGNDFNWDYHVSFPTDQVESGEIYYNYHVRSFPASEGPGISSFFKDENGEVFHVYSTFARGLENFLGIYNFLDIVPKGRDEAGLPYGMAWVRYRDRYDDESFVDPYA